MVGQSKRKRGTATGDDLARMVGPFITKAPWLRKVRNDAKGYGKRVRK